MVSLPAAMAGTLRVPLAYVTPSRWRIAVWRARSPAPRSYSTRDTLTGTAEAATAATTSPSSGGALGIWTRYLAGSSTCASSDSGTASVNCRRMIGSPATSVALMAVWISTAAAGRPRHRNVEAAMKTCLMAMPSRGGSDPGTDLQIDDAHHRGRAARRGCQGGDGDDESLPRRSQEPVLAHPLAELVVEKRGHDV